MFYISRRILNSLSVTNDYYSLYTKYYSGYNNYTLKDILNSKEREAWLNKCNNIEENTCRVINFGDKNKDVFNALELMADVELLCFEKAIKQISEEEFLTSPVLVNYINNKNLRDKFWYDHSNKTKYRLALEYYEYYLAYRMGDKSSCDLIDSVERKRFLDTTSQIPFIEHSCLYSFDKGIHELYSNICVNLLDLEVHNGLITDNDLELTNSFKDFCKYQHNRNKKKVKLKMTR